MERTGPEEGRDFNGHQATIGAEKHAHRIKRVGLGREAANIAFRSVMSDDRTHGGSDLSCSRIDIMAF